MLEKIEQIQYDSKEVNDILYNIYETFTPESISNGLEKCDSLDDLGKRLLKLEDLVNKVFKEYLENYSQNIQDAFMKKNYVRFQGTEEEKKQLLYLIYQKNRLIKSSFLAYIENGGLDDILDVKDILDIIHILKNHLGKTFDTIYINWIINGEKFKEKLPSKLVYGGFDTNGNTVPYSYFTNLDFPEFDLNNNKLAQYINGFREVQNSTDEKTWLKNQELEPQIWKDKTSSLGAVGPQENYQLANGRNAGFIEPHFALFVKVPFEEEKKQGLDLANKYFGNSYDLKVLDTYLAEPILESGSTGFWKIAGESIPNDESLRESYGAINLVIPSRQVSRTLDAKEEFEQITQKEFDLEGISKESLKFVKFHEMGHSMFMTKENERIEIEELKADLFYFLSLLEESKKGEKLDIENIFSHFVIDCIRVFKNVNLDNASINDSMKRYVYAEGIILSQAFKTGFIKWKSNKLTYNSMKIEELLGKLKDIYFEVKDIYDKNGKDDEFLEKYFDLFENEDIIKFIINTK